MNLHKCYRYEYDNLKKGCYGEAISKCYEDKYNELWVDNEEYCNQVNYCPFCGYKAKIQKFEEDSK